LAAIVVPVVLVRFRDGCNVLPPLRQEFADWAFKALSAVREIPLAIDQITVGIRFA
jgi:hypothetical protein